jgi:hypothetical protein
MLKRAASDELCLESFGQKKSLFLLDCNIRDQEIIDIDFVVHDVMGFVKLSFEDNNKFVHVVQAKQLSKVKCSLILEYHVDKKMCVFDEKLVTAKF